MVLKVGVPSLSEDFNNQFKYICRERKQQFIPSKHSFHVVGMIVSFRNSFFQILNIWFCIRKMPVIMEFCVITCFFLFQFQPSTKQVGLLLPLSLRSSGQTWTKQPGLFSLQYFPRHNLVLFLDSLTPYMRQLIITVPCTWVVCLPINWRVRDELVWFNLK